MAYNGKHERTWPTRGIAGHGHIDWFDSEQIEAQRQIAANAEQQRHDLDPALLHRIAQQWQDEIARESGPLRRNEAA